MRFTSKFRNSLIGTLALAGLFLTVQPALAGSPIVYNQHGSYVPMSWGTKRVTPIKAWLPNSSHFYMNCWTDDDWYYGNYWTNRWFWGQSQYQGWGWVSASYVYYQVSVPHC